MNTISGDSSFQQLLSSAQLNVQGLLTEFALSEKFLPGIETAFGDNFNRSSLEQFYQQWQESNFDSFPEAEARSQAELNGANGAFSADTNKIYISREFLVGNSLDAITDVLLEEYGHYVDSQINSSDALGDEGDIFSRLVKGENLNSNELEQLRAEDDRAIAIIDGDSVAIEQASNNLKQVVQDGLNNTLIDLEEKLINRVFSSTLPIVGSQLKSSDAVKFISDFREDISNRLSDPAVNSIEDIEQALFEVLGTDGSDLLQDLDEDGDVDLDDIIDVEIDGDNCQFEFKLADSLDVFEIALGEHFGLPEELCLELIGADAKANVGLDYELYFKFGVDFDENTDVSNFYWDTNPLDTEEFKLDFDFSLPELTGSENNQFEGNFGFFDLGITDKDSSFTGGFSIDLGDGDGDDKLEDDEEFTLDPKLTGELNINLGFDASISDALLPDNFEFPEFETDFNVDWQFTDSLIPEEDSDNPFNFGELPRVYFTDVKLKLGSFFDFARPILEDIQDITQPVGDIIDLLNKNYSLGRFTLPSILDIAEFASEFGESEFPLSTEEIDFIRDFGDIIGFVNSIPTDSNGTLNFGNFDLGTVDIRNPNFDLGAIEIRELGNLDPLNLPNEIPTFDFNPLDNFSDDNESDDSNKARGFYTNIPDFEGGSFEFPIFDDPSQVFNLLIGNIGENGENVNFFNLEFPEINFKAGYSQFFPIAGPLGARVGGEVGAEINLGFGYDAFGFKEFEKGNPNPEQLEIANGFYIEDFDADGNERPEVVLNAGLEASAELNAGIASAGVGGGVYGNINFDLNDPNDNNPDDGGRIRLEEFAGLLSNPECLFETSGSLTAGLRAYVKIGRGWFSRKKEYNSPRVTFATFDLPHSCPVADNAVTPIIATDTGNSIQLNAGGNAIAQLGIAPGSTNEGGGNDNDNPVTPIPGSEVINQWGRQYGTTSREILIDVSVDDFGNVYLTGYRLGQSENNLWVTQYNNNGNLIREIDLGEFNSSRELSEIVAEVDVNGNIFIAYGEPDITIIKYNVTGEALWQQEIAPDSYEFTSAIAVDGNGNVYIGGGTEGDLDGENAGDFDPWVAKYNTDGEQQWIRQLGTAFFDPVLDIETDDNNNVYVVSGQFQEFSDITKFDSQGEILWTVSANYTRHITVDALENVYYVSENSQGIYITKLDNSGDFLWRETVADYDSVSLFDIEGLSADSLGNIYLLVEAEDFEADNGTDNVFIVKLDTNGNPLWSREVGTSNFESAEDFTLDDSGNIYFGGNTDGSLFGNNAGNWDAWVAKFLEPSINQSLSLSASEFQFTSVQESDAELFLLNSDFSTLEVASEPNNTIEDAQDLGTVTGILEYRDKVDSNDNNDYYLFSVNTPSKLGILLNNLTQDVDIQLLSEDGATVLASSVRSGTESELIDFNVDNPGTYLLRVYPFNGAETDYKLTLAVINQDELFQVTKSAENPNAITVSRDFEEARDDDGNLILDENNDVVLVPLVTQEFTTEQPIEADGGAGDDTFHIDPDISNIARIKGGTGNDEIIGGAGDDSLEGGEGEDALIGGVGIDVLEGNEGDDLLEGGLGADNLDGGEGSDTVSYVNSLSGVNINLALGTFEGEEAAGDTFTSIENLAGSDFDDVLVGDEQNNILNGWNGNDNLSGNAGNDLLIGGLGADSLSGGVGNDTVSYITSDSGVSVNLLTLETSGGEAEGDVLLDSWENLEGSDYDDTLSGNDSDNRLEGNLGNDILEGGLGDDTLVAGDGSFTIQDSEFTIFQGSADTLKGGAGDDVYQFNITRVKSIDLSEFSVASGSQVEDLEGEDSLTLLISEDNQPELINATLNLSSPSSETIGIARNDTSLVIDIDRDGIVNPDNDLSILNYFNESRTGAGTGFIETVANLSGTDIVNLVANEAGTLEQGNTESELLTGGNGDDTLIGGGGADTLEGGLGNDIYELDPETAAGSQIKDTVGIDSLILDGADISLSEPEINTIGVAKDGTTLIIDLNQDGMINPENDLTILDYFDESATGEGTGFIETVANLSGVDILNFLVNTETSRGSIVYRFYNPSKGVHFYTADENESNYVRDNLDNYDYEGESYVTVDPVTGNSPEEVYRFFNSTTGVHLYTTDENERDYIIDNLDNFTYEDVKFYAYETKAAGTVPIHRFYEPSIGVHFYTPNEGEKTYVENNLSNYVYESVAYYAFPIDEI